jgi:hypothetical protein
MKLHRILLGTVAISFIGAHCPDACAQNTASSYVRREIPAVKTSVPPVVDGDISDACWQHAAIAQIFLDQAQGTIAPDQTEALILYDARYIYIAFHCKDSRPERIVARETVRDIISSETEDRVEVTIDTFLSHQRADFSRFFVNPLGTRAARIAGGRANKAEWKGDWDAAAKRVPDGWTAEMRIPWAILNFSRRRHTGNIGINFRRWQQHTRIESVWSNIGPQEFPELEGVWTQVEVPQETFHPHLSLLPYTLSSFAKSGSSPQFGMDVRYSLSPELTSVASINPDFGTVENAVESITFSRSEQYVRETRSFFLEGRGYFGGFNSGSYLFYSNRIQSFDAGAKLYGKITPVDTLAFLNTTSFGVRDDTVMRLLHSFSPTASASFFFNQMSAANDNNTVGQIAGDSRWGKFSAGGQWIATGGHKAGGDAKSVGFGYADKYFTHGFEILDYAPTFRAADGLVPFTDYKGFDDYEDYQTHWRHGFWQGFDATVGVQYDWHQSGRPFQRGGGLNIRGIARQDWGLGLHLNYDRFEDQTDATYGIDFTSGLSNRYRQWGFFVLTGKQADRPSTFVGPAMSTRLFKRLDLTYSGAIQNRNGITSQHVLTLAYELSPTRTLAGRLVRLNGVYNGYLSFRNSGGRGINSYVILGDPNATRFMKRISVKLVFPL